MANADDERSVQSNMEGKKTSQATKAQYAIHMPVRGKHVLCYDDMYTQVREVKREACNNTIAYCIWTVCQKYINPLSTLYIFYLSADLCIHLYSFH